MKNKGLIKYISFFDFQDSKVRRNYVTSATNKIESICQILSEIGYEVQIISPSSVIEPKFKFYKGRKVKERDGLQLKTFFSWGGKNPLLRKAKAVWHVILLFLYLLFNTKKDETILVYHSLGYFKSILWAKKIKKFKMILEVEEIYQDVGKIKRNSMAKVEYPMIEAADAYIFPTELLNSKLNIHNKPYAIIYGTYTVEPQITEKFNDGKIHVVYAGTFDPRKGGAAAAAAAAELPDRYHFHICGFGSEEETRILQEQIEAINKGQNPKISLEGLLKGNDYIKLLQKCQIGLSTQDPSAKFNNTSFPSKILSYMCNGLSVVSIDIPAIRNSLIGNFLTYYRIQEPREIANAICNSEIENNNREEILKLRRLFISQITHLLESTSPSVSL